MDWNDRALAALSRDSSWSYQSGGTAASEPAALTALALIGAGRVGDAARAIDWLCELQSADGSVGVTAEHKTPCWPTGWAVLAWTAALRAGGHERLQRHIDRATAWLLDFKGKTLSPTADLGHNSMLVGWPWVEGTHSWLEPTAINILALRAAGFSDDQRTREGTRLLVDRLLPDGGCNYGNTFVLGQKLRGHLEPSGLCLLALAGQSGDARISKTVDYVAGQIRRNTTTASLSYALLGLAAHGHAVLGSEELLAVSFERCEARGLCSYKLALLTLAQLGDRGPLMLTADSGAQA